MKEFNNIYAVGWRSRLEKGVNLTGCQTCLEWFGVSLVGPHKRHYTDFVLVFGMDSVKFTSMLHLLLFHLERYRSYLNSLK